MPSQAMSGVQLADDVKTMYDDMKHGSKKQRYIQMKISDDSKMIVIEKTANRDETPKGYENFVEQLPPAQCRYAVVNYTLRRQETGAKDLLLFVVWCPDNASVKEKMMYASSKDAIKSACQGVAAEIQANDFDEVAVEAIEDKVKGKK